MVQKWTNALADYFETSCMYDNIVPFDRAPNTRGNCLALANEYVRLAENEYGVEDLYVCLVNNTGRDILEHAVVLWQDGLHVPWVVDLSYGITRPLRLSECIGDYAFYYSNGGFLLDLAPNVFTVNRNRAVTDADRIRNLNYGFQTTYNKCAMQPIINCQYYMPFSVRINKEDFYLNSNGEKVLEGTFSNGVDDSNFQSLTDKLFECIYYRYGQLAPITSEDEFLSNVQSFLDGYPNLSPVLTEAS